MFEEDFLPLTPASFLQLKLSSPYFPPHGCEKELKNGAYKLPDTSLLCQEESFADLYMGWNQEGLHVKSNNNVEFLLSMKP